MDRRKFIQSSAATLVAHPLINAYSKTGAIPKGNGSELNVGIIGIGVRGRHLMNVINADVPGMRIMAYCDILDAHLSIGATLADDQAKGYRDYRRLLDDPRIDAVFIATPLHLHFPVAMAAIEAGKHVYCEKTLAYNISQSLAIARAVGKSSCVFHVGYQERSSPLFRQIYRLINNDVCGTIISIDCSWNRNGNWRRPVNDPANEQLINWRMYRAYSGGLMAELCSHQIDLVNWITQSHPLKARGSAGIDFWKDGRETFDNVTAILDYPKGLKARFTALTTNAIEGFRMKFYGTKATIEVNRENGQQGFIYPEAVPGVDGITGATDLSESSVTKVPLLVDDNPTFVDDSTSHALIGFRDAILTNALSSSAAESACLSSISVHMANLAMENDTIETWREEYQL